MKKTYLAISGISILALAFYGYYKYQLKKLQDFEWKIKSFNLRKFSLNELLLDVTFLFTNKSDVEATIKKVYIDLYVQGINVGYIQEVKGFVLPARGTSSVPLTFSVNPQAIFKNVISIISGAGANKDLQFTLKGYANIKSGFVSTTIPIDYTTTVKEYLGIIKPIT